MRTKSPSKKHWEESVFYIHWRAKSHVISVSKGNGWWHCRNLTSWKCWDISFGLWYLVSQCEHQIISSLLKLQRDMVMDARRIGNSISKIMETFDLSQSMVSLVYGKCLTGDITTHCRQRSDRSRVIRFYGPVNIMSPKRASHMGSLHH